MNPETQEIIDVSATEPLVQRLNPDDLDAYRYFYQLFKTQEEALNQYQGYISKKYSLTVNDKINLDTGVIQK
jgi:hypothetical protein